MKLADAIGNNCELFVKISVRIISSKLDTPEFIPAKRNKIFYENKNIQKMQINLRKFCWLVQKMINYKQRLV